MLPLLTIRHTSLKEASLIMAAILLAVSSVAVALTAEWVGLALMLTGVLAGPPLIALLSGRMDPWAPVYLVIGSYFLQFVSECVGVGLRLVPFLPYYMTEDEFDGVLPAAMVCASVSLCCFYLGYYSRLGEDISWRLPSLRSSWIASHVRVVIALYLTAGALAWATLVMQNGGLASYLLGLKNVHQVLLGRQYLVTLSGYLPMYALVICRARARETGLASDALAANVVFLLAAAPAVTAGQRGSVVWLFLCMKAADHYISMVGNRKRWYAAAVVANWAGIAMLVVLLSAAVQLKFGRGRMLAAAVGADAEVTDALGDRGERVSLRQSLVAMLFRGDGVEVLGRILGRTGRVVRPAEGRTLFVDSVSQMVPRALWPQKPFPVGIRFFRQFLDNAVGDEFGEAEATTAPGELYWNGFYPGVVVGMITLGVLCRAGYAYFMRNRNASGLLIYVGVATSALSLNETPSSVLSMLICHLAVALAAYYLLADRLLRKRVQ